MSRQDDVGGDLLARGVKLRQLALLVAVERSGQLGRAAGIMHMTQPAASRMLADLERLFGTALTQRHSRGVSLTPAGQRLAERARSMLRDLDLAGREVQAIGRGQVGQVRLGSVSGPSLDLVLPVVRGLERAEPLMRVIIKVDSSDRLAAALLAGELDLYLGRIPERLDPAPFEQTPVGPEPLALVVRRGHALDRPDCTLADCLAFDWVMQPAGSVLHGTVARYLDQRGLDLPRTVIATGSIMLTLAFARQSQAVGVISAAAARQFADFPGAPLVLLPVAEDLNVAAYSLVTLRGQLSNPAVAAFMAVLRTELDLRRG
ncbi:LysR family transcriptional regulator [Paracoccus limosus]|nr:LysR family transcriptional regulator [Paracoccus limosus]